jgi:hypothetical protein
LEDWEAFRIVADFRSLKRKLHEHEPFSDGNKLTSDSKISARCFDDDVSTKDSADFKPGP